MEPPGAAEDGDQLLTFCVQECDQDPNPSIPYLGLQLWGVNSGGKCNLDGCLPSCF